MDRAIRSMHIEIDVLVLRMEGFQLVKIVSEDVARHGTERKTNSFQVWHQTLRIPTLDVPAVKVNSLCTSVHHEIDGAPTTQTPAHGHNGFTSIQMLTCF